MKSHRRFTRFALVPALLIACTAALAQDKPDPVGYWDVVVDMGGTPLNANLIVTKNDDGSYGGTLKSPMGDLAVPKVEYDGSEAIKFAAKVGEGDTAISFSFDGKFTGKDAFEGTLVSETMGTMTVKATRGSPANPLAGVWDLVSDSQLGKLDRKLVVYKDSTGKYVTDKDNLISELKVEGANVSFKVTVSAQGQDIPLTFAGTATGDSLTGKFTADGNDMATVTGKKSAIDIVAAAIGKWSFEAETPAGPYTADLIIDSATSGKLIATEGEAVLRKIAADGDRLTYDVTVNYQGQMYDVSFAGAVTAETMEGDLLMAGSPVATVKCKKAPK